jgi:hypothetical protein
VRCDILIFLAEVRGENEEIFSLSDGKHLDSMAAMARPGAPTVKSPRTVATDPTSQHGMPQRKELPRENEGWFRYENHEEKRDTRITRLAIGRSKMAVPQGFFRDLLEHQARHFVFQY